MKFKGHIRRDDFGRIVVDTCESDLAHLTKSDPLLPGQDRHQCRQLVEEAFAELVGKKGFLYVDVELVEDSATPDCLRSRTPEELRKLPRLTKEQIDEAMAAGERDRRAALKG